MRECFLLPPKLCYPFQEANLLLNLSSTKDHTEMDLKEAPKDKPKYFEGRLPTLQPN